MRVTVDRSRGKSPYVRYNKQPYQYAFYRCEHNRRTAQQTATWAGRVCANCNIILTAFGRNGNDRSPNNY